MKLIVTKNNYNVKEYNDISSAKIKNNTLIVKDDNDTVEELEGATISEAHNLEKAEFSYNGTLRNRRSSMSRIEVSSDSIFISYNGTYETIDGEKPKIIKVRG